MLITTAAGISKKPPVGRLLGIVTSRKPEDLPAELLFRCFGLKHPTGMVTVRLNRPMPLREDRSGPSMPGTGRKDRDRDGSLLNPSETLVSS
jgi:hypothetical protein